MTIWKQRGFTIEQDGGTFQLLDRGQFRLQYKTIEPVTEAVKKEAIADLIDTYKASANSLTYEGEPL